MSPGPMRDAAMQTLQRLPWPSHAVRACRWGGSLAHGGRRGHDAWRGPPASPSWQSMRHTAGWRRPLASPALTCMFACLEAHGRRKLHHVRPSKPGPEPGLSESCNTTEDRCHPHASDAASEIVVVDFSSDSVRRRDCADAAALGRLLGGEGGGRLREVPADTRWIYVNRPSPQVMAELARSKGLHRLAVEDVLHGRSRTKVDWYESHLCAIVTLQKLVDASETWDGESAETTDSQKDAGRPGHMLQLHPRRSLQSRSALALRQGLAVRVEQASIFLTADGTVVTTFEGMGREVLEPILARLGAEGTVVRTSGDASMLLYAVLDTIVDLALPIANAYGAGVRELERGVLTEPRVAQSVQLYALRAELALLEALLKPVDGLINALRDGARAAAGPPISPLARTYLADVHDHALELSAALRACMHAADNLTSLIFNTVGARQNASIRQLTLVTIFFLPLTFLTGYFGMNFDPFWAVNEHSDLFFWALAVPTMLATTLFLARGDRARALLRRVRRRMAGGTRRAAPKIHMR